jgi:hypothetical protein
MRAPAPPFVLFIALATALLGAGGARAAAARAAHPSQTPAPAPTPQMRGSQPTEPARRAKPSRLPVAYTPMAADPVAPDPGQCRLSCGQAYYFCLAGAAPNSCSSDWTRCRTACSRESPEP